MQKIPEYFRKGVGEIPDSVAEPPFKEDIETRPFMICYRHYNDKQCEVRDLQKNVHLRILQDFRTIGKLTSLKEFKNYNIDILSVNNTGEYKKIYSNLSPDIEIKEHKLQGTARIFYFTTIDKVFNIFNIVAITNRHFETDKVRK